MKLLVLISLFAVARGDIARGPSIFQYGNKVYLVVAPAVIVNVFQNVTEGSHLKQHDEIILNGPATEFSATLVKKANSTSMEVNFKWDDVDFSGEKENKTKLTSLSAKMTFTRKLRKYSLTGAEVTSAKINATRLTNISLQVHTEYGNFMSAPIGSSFCCSNFGMLRPMNDTLNTTQKNVTVGLTFPEVRLHVFDVKQPFGLCNDCNLPKGPSIFEYRDKVYLIVAPAVTANVFQRVNGSKQFTQQDEIILNGTATEFSATSIKEANSTSMEVNFEWDEVDFKGQNNNKTNLTSLSAKLTFTKNLKKYSLTRAEVTRATINGIRLTNNSLQVHTSAYPYNIMSAPLGSSFRCSNFGMLKPTKGSLNTTLPFALGLTFPEVRLHVFDAKQPFGPCTDCDLGIPIAFWMQLIITLIFALICYYGFSMLASITTNDRWEDPKGKPIQVPQQD